MVVGLVGFLQANVREEHGKKEKASLGTGLFEFMLGTGRPRVQPLKRVERDKAGTIRREAYCKGLKLQPWRMNVILEEAEGLPEYLQAHTELSRLSLTLKLAPHPSLPHLTPLSDSFGFLGQNPGYSPSFSLHLTGHQVS